MLPTRKVISTSKIMRFKVVFYLVFAFFLGVLYGRITAPSKSGHHHTKVGMIKHLDSVPHRPTSHKDTDGKFIMKQQFLEPFLVPNFVGFSVATFEPGQRMMPAHVHDSMYEFFYVLKGKAVIVIDDVEHEIGPSTLIHLVPGEKHGIYLPNDFNTSMQMAVFGVVDDITRR